MLAGAFKFDEQFVQTCAEAFEDEMLYASG
jgi:hypothetical protein